MRIQGLDEITINEDKSVTIKADSIEITGTEVKRPDADNAADSRKDHSPPDLMHMNANEIRDLRFGIISTLVSSYSRLSVPDYSSLLRDAQAIEEHIRRS